MVADFLFLSVTVTVVLPALTPLMVILLSLTLAVATFDLLLLRCKAQALRYGNVNRLSDSHLR